MLETQIYADVLFLVNFSMDYISLYTASKIASCHASTLRLSLAAAVGALFGTVLIIFSFSGFVGILLTLLLSFLMILVAFGKTSAWRLVVLAAVLWGTGALLGGIMTLVCSLADVSPSYADTPPFYQALILGAGSVLSVICIKVFSFIKARKTAEVTIVSDGKAVSFTALCDSGNLVRDPLSHKAVIFIDISIMKKILPSFTLDDGVDGLPEGFKTRVRFIPVKSINESSVVFGFVPDETIVCTGKNDKRKCDFTVAVLECGDKNFGGYPANIPL